MNTITVIDYDCGNLFSVARAIEARGGRVELTSDADTIASAERVILPGVGAFGSARAALDTRGCIEAIHAFVKTGNPFMGICLGMQLLFDNSEEFGTHDGLGIIPGRVAKIDAHHQDGSSRLIPHIGWSPLTPPDYAGWAGTLFEPLNKMAHVYFVHSYVGMPYDRADTLAVTNYDGMELCAAVARDNVTGVQFHPEKSGPTGLRLIEHFVNGS